MRTALFDALLNWRAAVLEVQATSLETVRSQEAHLRLEAALRRLEQVEQNRDVRNPVCIRLPVKVVNTAQRVRFTRNTREISTEITVRIEGELAHPFESAVLELNPPPVENRS